VGALNDAQTQSHAMHHSAAESLLPKKRCGIKANVVSVCSSQTFADCGQGNGMKELYIRPSVHPSSFLSFFLRICLSIHPSVSPSVHPSFFLSLTSPSSLAPFSVSLIYIFLVSFSATTWLAYSVCVVMYILLPTCNSLIFCQFCTWNIWFQISTYLKDFSWKINGPKLARLCGKKKFIKHKTFMISSIMEGPPFPFFFKNFHSWWCWRICYPKVIVRPVVLLGLYVGGALVGVCNLGRDDTGFSK
jgi:hypothetical protein